MSEYQPSISVQLRPVTPSFDSVRRFIICLDEQATSENVNIGTCRLAYIPLGASYYQYLALIGEGAHYISMSVYLGEVEEYTVDIFMQASNGQVLSDLYYITTLTLKLGEPRSLSFRFVDEYPFIEGLVLTPVEEAEERKREVLMLSTNDPNTLSTIDAINKVGSDIWDAVTGLRGGISGLAGLANGLIGGFFTSLLSNITGILNKGSNAYAEESIKTFIDITKGSPIWFRELIFNRDANINFLKGNIPENMDIGMWIPTEKTDEDYVKSSYAMASKFMDLTIDANLTGTSLEAIGLGQLEGFTNIYNTLINQYGINDIVKNINLLPFQKALLTPYEYAINTAFPNELPTNADLINMVVKEKITLDTFKANMLKQGLNIEWSQLLWDAHFIAPDYNSVRTAYHRGNVSEEELLPLLQRVDLDPEFNEQIWLPNLWIIPPYTDLINMRVKEVISEGVFAQNLRSHGYDPIWGQRLWDAHFFPPTQGDIITAWRRRIPVTIPEFDPDTGTPQPRQVEQLTLDDVHQLMQLVDLDPRYTSIFDTRLYNDPTIRQARYMYETGAISEDTVQDIVRRSGLSPEYIEPMTEYLIEFTEREYRRRYLTALQSGIMSGVYSPKDLVDAVIEAGFPVGVAEWMLKTAEVRMKIAEAPRPTAKPKLLSISDLKKAYLKDFIDDPELRLRLDAMGYEFTDIELLVKILDESKIVEEEGRRQVVLTTAQLINAFRFGEITESDLRDRLMLKGLAMDEAQMIIDTKKKQWGVGGE